MAPIGGSARSARRRSYQNSKPSLKAKFGRLRRAFGRVPNVRLDTESPREGYLQTLLSRGDRRVGAVLQAIHAAGGNWWSVIRAWQRDGIAGLPHPDAYVHRAYGDGELFPWDFIDHGIPKESLYREYERRVSCFPGTTSEENTRC